MDPREEIIAAVKANDVARARALLQGDPALLATPTLHGSLLLTATYHGSREVVGLLLDLLPVGRLDLFEASATGQVERLAQILEGRPDLANATNPEGFTPLGLAAFFGHRRAVELLVARGAEVNMVDRSRFGNAPLDAAVAANHGEVVTALLAAGAEANVRDRHGTTPLHKAAMNGNAEVAAALLGRGADVSARDAGGRTPLALALEAGHARVAELLRRHGAVG